MGVYRNLFHGAASSPWLIANVLFLNCGSIRCAPLHYLVTNVKKQNVGLLNGCGTCSCSCLVLVILFHLLRLRSSCAFPHIGQQDCCSLQWVVCAEFHDRFMFLKYSLKVEHQVFLGLPRLLPLGRTQFITCLASQCSGTLTCGPWNEKVVQIPVVGDDWYRLITVIINSYRVHGIAWLYRRPYVVIVTNDQLVIMLQ